MAREEDFLPNTTFQSRNFKSLSGILLLEVVAGCFVFFILGAFLFRILHTGIFISKRSNDMVDLHNFQFGVDYILQEARSATAIYPLSEFGPSAYEESKFLPFVILTDEHNGYFEKKHQIDRWCYSAYYSRFAGTDENELWRVAVHVNKRKTKPKLSKFSGNNRIAQGLTSFSGTEYLQNQKLLRLRMGFRAPNSKASVIKLSHDVFVRNKND